MFCIVVLALGTGGWLLQQPTTEGLEGELLFVDLSQKANKIDRIQIENSSGTLLNAYLSEGNWIAKVGYTDLTYPADQAKLASLVSVLLQAKLVEAKTKNKSKYFRLGVQGVEIEDSMARLVTINAGDDSWQILVGNKFSVGDGTYVRFPKQTQSWRLDKTIDLPLEPFGWLTHPILPISAQDILGISRTDNNQWKIDKNQENYELSDLPDNKELKYESILNGFVANLASLDYEELVEAESSFVDSLEVEARFEVFTQESGVFNLILSQAKDIHYVHLESTDNHDLWQKGYYQISSYSAQQLNKSIEDFVSDLPLENEEVNIEVVEEEIPK